MPTNGLLLLLDRSIIKGMHISCFCILMQLLTHYDHVIVQSLIAHPVCNAAEVVVFFCAVELEAIASAEFAQMD